MFENIKNYDSIVMKVTMHALLPEIHTRTQTHGLQIFSFNLGCDLQTATYYEIPWDLILDDLAFIVGPIPCIVLQYIFGDCGSDSV